METMLSEDLPPPGNPDGWPRTTWRRSRGAFRATPVRQPFGIRCSTTLSIVKLAAWAGWELLEALQPLSDSGLGRDRQEVVVGEPLCVTEIAFAAAPAWTLAGGELDIPVGNTVGGYRGGRYPYLVVRGLASNRLAGLGQEFTAT